jgi:flagellar biogenesis protein FliO
MRRRPGPAHWNDNDMDKLRPTLRAFAGVSTLAAPAIALAAAPAQPPAPSIAGDVLGIVLPVALIIVALLAVLFFVRRRFGLSRGDAPLSILQILPVGSRERIVVVRSRSGRVFAVGVAGQSVTLITNLEQSDVAPIAAQAPREGAGPVV